MRSDFLDRAAEDQRFVSELTRGLIFLQVPDRQSLGEAITQPLDLANHQFESGEIVEKMLDEIEGTHGALPLLQFAVTKLWEARDRRTRLLTEQSFRGMGGVAGALSTHADGILSQLPLADQKTVRAIFQRLITSEGTRAIVDMSEMLALADDPRSVQRVVDYLVQARLLVVQTRSDTEGPVVEIVHDSLINSWPTLRRWMEEDKDLTAFLEHLRNAAKQWETKGRPQGLLWTGDAEEEARFWSRSYIGELPPLERAYLDAVFELSERARRRRRAMTWAVFTVLTLVTVGAIIALVTIRQAERRAVGQAHIARQAEQRVKQQLDLIQRKERERRAAERAKQLAEADVSQKKQQLKRSYDELEKALRKAETEKARALEATRAAKDAARKAQDAAERIKLLVTAERKARETAEMLLKQRITTDLR